jgi:CBS domain-containing protein
METMTDRRFRHLPIVEDGRILGLVSIGDLVAKRIEEAESETQAMKAYIAS